MSKQNAWLLLNGCFRMLEAKRNPVPVPVPKSLLAEVVTNPKVPNAREILGLVCLR